MRKWIAILSVLAVAAMFGLVMTTAPRAIAEDGDVDEQPVDQPEAPAVATINELAPEFTLTDTNGDDVTLSDLRGKYVVLEWINFDCPYVVMHYSGSNMQDLQKKYVGDDVVWLSICSSAEGKQGYFAGEELTSRMAKENWAGSHYLPDADGTVGHQYLAKTTPHMYVIDKEGVLRYTGAIDSKRPRRASDIADATNYVAAALDSLMAGEDVAEQVTRSYG